MPLLPNDKLQELTRKWLNGTISPDEKKILNEWYNHQVPEQIEWRSADADESALKERLFKNISDSIRPETKVISFNYKKIIYWAAAAVVLIFFSVIYFHPNRQKPAQQISANQLPVKLPVGSKAVLTLADGSKIGLDSAKNGMLTKQGNSAVNKAKSGILVYDNYTTPQGNSKIAYNTISTLRGGEYQVTLSDGTKVWLNAASSITFPTSFQGKFRRVEITGEAYFEVEKNKDMPFQVFANGAEVEVLGTHFDVMAYQDEPELRTTLLEGSVKFKRFDAEVLLKPGQQATTTSGSKNILVQQADIEETMAWKNHYFMFHDENIKSIMRKVSRWYDVDVVYDGNTEGKEFGGKISRNENVNDLLKTLELPGNVHFKLEGRRVTVTL